MDAPTNMMRTAAIALVLSNFFVAPAIAQECAQDIVGTKWLYQLNKPLNANVTKAQDASRAKDKALLDYYTNKRQAILLYGYYRAGPKTFASDILMTRNLTECLRVGEYPRREDCGIGTNQAAFKMTRTFGGTDQIRARALSVIPAQPSPTTNAFIKKYLGSCALPMPVKAPKVQKVVQRKAPPPAPPRPTVGKYPLSVCNESVKVVSYMQLRLGQTVSSKGNSYYRHATPNARAWRDDWNKRRSAGKTSCDGIPKYIYSYVMESRASAQRQAEHDRRYGEKIARERAKWDNYKSRYPSNSYMGNASGSSSAPAGAISSSEAYSNAKANSATTCRNTGGSNCDR